MSTDIEDSVRQALRQHEADAPTGSLLPAVLRQGYRLNRRRHGRQGLAVAGVVVALGGVSVGLSQIHGYRPSAADLAAAKHPTCPAVEPIFGSRKGDVGSGGPVVPGSPSSYSICVWKANQARTERPAYRATSLAPRPLAAALNAGDRLPAVGEVCPDYGDLYYVVTFFYSSGGHATLGVWPTGCAEVRPNRHDSYALPAAAVHILRTAVPADR
ncbi:MAG: hypothetical protein ACR2FF_04620 [Mycobacteriales bacterium]